MSVYTENWDEKRWYYDEPTDFTADYNRRIVYTERMIFEEHVAAFMGKDMIELTKNEKITLHTAVVYDWLICNFATRTDMPVGEYITYTRYLRPLKTRSTS